MKTLIQIGIVEIESLPKAYQALDSLTREGLEALDFCPHAEGVRILMRIPEGFAKAISSSMQKVEVSTAVVKALLSQTNHQLKKHYIVAESNNLKSLMELAMEFEQAQADILEIRSLRANPKKNYALFTLENAANCPKNLKNFDHVVLESNNSAAKEFFGFK